jgi:phosphonate transport system substrate-binding protein
VEAGEDPSGVLFGRQTKEVKAAKVILPVFFGQADACVVPRTSFMDMAELNPQVGEQLRILATSPEVVSSFLCFREGYASRYRPQIEAAIRDLHLSSAGKQVLTVFGCEQIAPFPPTCLQSAYEMVRLASRPSRRTIAAETVPTPGRQLPRREP